MTRSRRGIGGALVLSLWAAAAAAQEWRTDFSRHTVPLDEIVSGGPPKDGIAAIDRPAFESVAEAEHWLAEREPVIVIETGDEVRAYPLQILIWHEIVNDAIGGQGGRLVGIEADGGHPLGMICRRGRHAPEIVHSEHRLAHPMRRAGSKGTLEFDRITWDEACSPHGRIARRGSLQ